MMEPGSTYIVLSREEYEEIFNMLKSIKNSLDTKKKKVEPFNGFVSQSEAEECLGRKSTWFWHQVKMGRLNVKKIGRRNYYSIEDLEGLLKGK